MNTFDILQAHRNLKEFEKALQAANNADPNSPLIRLNDLHGRIFEENLERQAYAELKPDKTQIIIDSEVKIK